MNNKRRSKSSKNSYGNIMSRVLPMALFVACQAFNPSAFAAETPQPTLDIMHNSGIMLTSASDVYPQSEFTFTEVTPADPDNLAPNVVKYYDPNKLDNDVHYYEIGLKNPVYGTGTNEKYYKWARDEKGVKLVTTDNQSESVLTVKYDASTYVKPILNGADDEITLVDEIYVGQDIKSSIDNKGVIEAVASKFFGNEMSVNNQDTFNYSSVLAEAGARIGSISSSFIANNVDVDAPATTYGTLIKVLGLGEVGEIKSEFLGNGVNTNTALSGGLIQVNGTVGDMQTDFINNLIQSESANIDGGLIGNEGRITSLHDSRFLNNSTYSGAGAIRGGAIYNADGGRLKVSDTVFTGNSARTVSGSALGGALYDAFDAVVENNSFYGNYATAGSGGVAHGGAIYTNSGLTISANDGKTSEFTGNYVINNGVKSNEAIYVEGRNKTLTLSATDNGKIIINDNIAGDSGFKTTFTGDSTGNIYIFGDIIDSRMSASSTNINLMNSDMKNYDWLSLSSDNSAKFDIDINFGNKTSDTFTLGQGSAGVLVVDKLNLIGDLPTVSTVVQVLTAPDEIQLIVSDALKAQYAKETHGEYYDKAEEIDKLTYWDRDYMTKTQKDVVSEGLRGAVSASGRATPDSIEYFVETEYSVLSEIKTDDTLKLVNQADIGDRTFQARRETDEYKVGADLGSTATGILTVRGKYNDETEKWSKIHAGEHTLFELNKDGTDLILREVDITSNKDAEGAIVNATASDTSITFTGATPIDVSGVAGSNGFVNNGTMNIETEVTSNVGVTGDGTLNVKKNLTLSDDASVVQNVVNVTDNSSLLLTDGAILQGDGGINVASGSTLQVTAAGLQSDVSNAGTLNLGAGTLVHSLNGAGNTVMKGNVVLDHELGAKIYTPMKFTPNSSLTANADDIQATIARYTTYTAAEDATIALNLTGGTLTKNITWNTNAIPINILGNTQFNATVMGHIYVKDGVKLTTSANNLLANSTVKSITTVEEGGELHITGGGSTSNKAAPGQINGNGHVYIEGNTSIGNTITAKNLTINSGVRLTSYGDYIKSPNITNNGILQLNNSNSNLTVPVSGTGYLTNTGTVYVRNNINQKVLVTTGSFRTDAKYLNGPVENNGYMCLNWWTADAATNKLKVDITGTGGTEIHNSLNNNYVDPVTGRVGVDFETYIAISPNMTFTTNADHLLGTYIDTYPSWSNAQGILTLTGGTLSGSVRNKGKLNIATGAEVTANKYVQAAIQVYTDALLKIDADNVRNDVTLSQNGTIRLGDGTIAHTINGATGLTEIAGDVTLSGRRIYSPVSVMDTGTFHAPLEFLFSSINNDGSFYTHGDLDKTITGTGTTYINDAISLSGDGGIATTGKFNLNNGGLSAAGYGTEYTLGTAKGTGNLSLNIDAVANKSQSFLLNEDSDGIFKLSSAWVGRTNRIAGKTDIIQILKGGTVGDTDFSRLVLETESEDGKLHSWYQDKVDIYDEVAADTYYDAQFGMHTDYYTVYSSVVLATTDTPDDSIKWTVDRIDYDDSVYHGGDLLAGWNQYNAGSTEKFFRFRTENDVYKSTEVPGTQASGVENIIGVSSVNDETGEVTRSKINIGYDTKIVDGVEVETVTQREGINVGSGSTFNISNIEFVNGYKNIITTDGGKFGNIDPDTHEATGGIVNTTFDNVTIDESGTDNFEAYLVHLTDATVSQIKDSSFSNNSFKYTNSDTVYYNPSMSGAVLRLDNTKVGDTYTVEVPTYDAEGNPITDGEGNPVTTPETRYTGGIINSVIDNNYSKLTDSTANNAYRPLEIVNGSEISQIIDTKITNNTKTSSKAAAQQNFIVSNSKIHRILNLDFSGNKTISSTNGDIPGILITASSVVDLIKDSQFKNNVGPTGVTGAGSLYVNSSSVIKEMDNVTFDSNTMRNGAAIYLSAANINTIKNSKFLSNTTSMQGGAIYMGSAGKITTLKDSLFEKNKSTTRYGAAIGIAGASGNTMITTIDNVKFLNNTATNTDSNTHYGGAISMTASSTNQARIGTITNSWFEGNRVTSSNRTIDGGAIGLNKSLISNITNTTFKNNSAYKTGSNYGPYGGAIFLDANSTISNINNVDFIENYALLNSNANAGAGGGAITNEGVITKITNSLFDGNYAQNKSNSYTVHGNGGAIYNTGTISELSNSVFRNSKAIGTKGNGHGGAINNGKTITTFKNNLFENNSASSVNLNAWGGALHNSSAITNGIVNSRFLNNSVTSTNGRAGGGAISTSKSLKIIATGEDGLTEFTGNTATYGGKTYNDAIIAMDVDGVVLTLQADTGGHILMNDRISGISYIENTAPSWQGHRYGAVLTGDLDSKISLFGDILGGDVTSNTGVNITTANDTPYDYHFNSWNSTNDAKWTIDVDFNNETADNFTLTEASSGRVYIDYLNILANKDDFATVQVLKTINDNIQLELNPEHINIVEDIRGSLGATVYNDEIYHQTEGYALATTDTTNDSITQLVNKDYDTLRIIGESRNNEIRNFNFRTDDEYTVTEDLTPLYSGEFSINGTEDGSVINSDGHKLFTVNKPTTFNINNVKITGTEDVIDVTDPTATVNLNNAYIDGNINSEDVFTLNIQGDKRTTITGDVSGANAKLASGELVIGATTMKDTTRFDVDGGTLRMDNDTVEDYQMSRLTSANAVKYNIDMDLNAQKADNITVSNTRSSGTVTIDNINFLNGSINTTSFVTQVLKGNTDELQLALSENVQRVRLSDLTRNEADAIREVTGFNDKYYNRTREGILWGDAYLATTQNTNDSIGLNVTQAWNDYTTIAGVLGDTLTLVNQSDLEERTFESYDAEDVYVLTDDLGTTNEGIMNINGLINGDEQSTIDLANHDGFVVGENTTLNINNTRITGAGSDDIITVTDSDAKVTIGGANLDGNITGTEHFNLELSGVDTTTLNGTVNNADVNLTKGGLIFNPNTFASDNTNLVTDGGYIYMNNDEIEEYTISNLTAGDKTKYAIDIDLSERETDTIVAYGGTGIIPLDEFNIIGRVQNISIDDEYVIQILKTDSDNLQLQFSETVASQLDGDYHLGDNHIILSTDEINPHTLWTDEYWQTEQDYEVWGRMALGTTDTENDSLKLYRMHTVTGEQRIKLGDTLKLLSRADIGDREFVFEDSSNVYHLSDNLNEVATGKIDVKGVAGLDGEGNPQVSTINMHKYSGWELDKDTELNISDVKFTNLAYKNNALLKVTNADAVVNLDNVSMDTTKSSYGISNAGTINATDGDVYLTTSVTGTGSFNVTGANTVIAGNSSIIQSAINVTDGSLTMTDGSVRGALSIGQNGTATVNTQGINQTVANEGTLNLKKDGTLIQNVTGNGTTNITANIVNGADIENDVHIAEGAEFSTARENVSGSIDNASKLNLSGTMSDVITGNGVTKVISSLNMHDGSGIVGTLNANNGNISTQDGVIDADINIGTLTGDATYSIDVLAAGTQSSADKFIVGNTSSGKILLDSVNFVTGSVLDSTFKAQIVDTNGTDDVYVQLSDALKEQRFFAGRTARPEEEEVNRITAYTKLYHTLERGGDLYGNLVESTTSTTNDSISIVIKDEYTVWDADDQRTETGLLGDTLALWNQLDTTQEKQFTFDAAETYKVGENFASVTGVGETKGDKVSVLGVTDGNNKSTIDLDGKTGFELKNATDFTLSDVKLTGNQTALVTVSNEAAKVTLTDAYIDGNIVGEEHFATTINGSKVTTINGTVTNTDATLASGTLKINTDTFADTNDSLTTTSNATVDLTNGAAGDTYIINKLTSNNSAKWNIDVSVTSESVFANDIIQAISADSSGIVKIDNLNITAGGFNTIPEDMRGKTFIMQILKAQNNNIQLDLSDYVKQQQLGNTDYLLAETYSGATEEAVAQHTQFDKDYMRTHTYLDTFGRLGLATKDTTNDSIGITINSSANRYEYEKIDDTLYLVNTAQIDDRTFDFVTKDDTYVVTKDLGTTATGEFSVNGVFADGVRSTINGTDSENTKYNLFKLADEQTLNLNNVKITGANSVAELTDEDAVLNLNNVEITGNTNGITSAGTVNLTGTNVIANNITGAGNTEIKSGTTEFSGNTSITQTAISVTGGRLTMADGLVNGALSVSDGAFATVNVEGIDHAVANEGDLTFKKDGTLAYDVTGGGTTNINGTIVNGANIANNVKVLTGAEFTTSRQAVGGTIDNANLLNLSGTLSDRITGNGTTNVNQALNMYDGAEIVGTLNANNGVISTQDTKISNFNIGTLTGNGSYAIDITSTGSADKFVAGADSSGKVAITGLNFLDSQNLNPNFKAQVINSASNGNLYLELSDEIKAQKYFAGRTSRDEEDTVNRITAYTELYKTYERGGDLKGTLVEATTNTTNDSIALEVKDEYTVWDTTRTQTGLMGDTLALWNQLDTNEVKQFTFDTAATYKVGENYPSVTGVGETKGVNVSILGVTDGNSKSTVDLNGKTGFELANATEFTLDNVKLTGNETALVNVSNTGAKINIKDSYVDGNITGSAKYTVDVNGTGTSTINGTIANADTTLTSGTLKINTNTFAATTDTLTTTEDATVDLSDNHAGDEFVINKLTSDTDAKWVIDVDVTNKLADKIQTTSADSSGKVLLNNLNITLGSFDDIPEDMRGKEFIVQVLKAQNANIQLDLSDAVKSQLGDKNYLIARGIIDSVDEEIKQHTQFDYEYKHTDTWGDDYGKLRLATKDTTNDSIGITLDHRESTDEVRKLDDTLYLVNTAEIDDRTFDFVTKDDTYVATKDLGTTATGEFSVNGVFADGVRSTINGTDSENTKHNLFKLADEQTLNLNNVKITGANSVAELTDEDAVLNLKNVEISGNTNGITSAGTVNLTGTNIIANNITGSGDTNLKSGSTTNKATIEQGTFTIEDAAAQLTNEGTIKAEFDNTIGADVTNKNSIVANGGSNAGAVTGAGTFANTQGNTFVNNGTITQTTVTNDGTWTNNNDIIASISNKSNGEMTSNADNLKGAVTNAGHVILTGGTTQNNYGGASTGTVEVTGDLTVNKTISGNELKLTSGVTQLTKDGSINGAKQLTANGGTLSIKDDYIGENPVDLGKVVLDKNLDLYIDADFATEKADVISASKGVVQGSDAQGNKNHILINNINIMSDAIEKMSMYVDVVDDTLRNKDYVALGSNVEATVLYSDQTKGGKDSFLVTYVDERGQLLVEYSTLPVAVSSDTKQKVYAMNDDEEVGDLGELHGNSLSISGNGHSVTGEGDSEGITVNKDKTLSVNNVDEYSGFDTAINNNGGSVNVRNTDFTDNTTDIANNKDSDGNGGNLVLEGEDNIDSIKGDGTTKISSYTDGTTTVNADVTINDTLEQDKVQIDANNELTTKGTTEVGTLDNAGTYNNQGDATISDALNNTGAINNGTEDSNATLTLNGEDMNIGGTVNNADGSEITIDGDGTTTLSANTTNNGDLNIDSDTNITGKITGTSGTTTVGSDAKVNVSEKVEQDSIVNNGELTSKADNLIANSGIDNEGNLNLTGGENKNTITGDGTTTFTGNSKNSGDITQKSVVNDGTLVNNSNIKTTDGLTNNSDAKLTNNGTVDGDLINNGTAVNNGSVKGDVINNNGADLTNNSKLDTKLTNDGKVTNKGVITAVVENLSNGEITTKIATLTSDSINNDGTIKYVDSGATVVDIKGSGRVELRNENNGTVLLNNNLDNNTLALYNGTLVFGNQKEVAGFEANGGNIHSGNGKIDTINLGNVTINKKTGLKLDFRLDDESSDKFLNNGVTNNGGSINVTGVNITGKTTKDYIRVHLGDTTTLGRKNVTSDTFKLPRILTPIRYLDGNVSGGWLTYAGTGNQYRDFNPAVMASSVAQQIGGFLTQSQTLQDSFFHMNRYTKYTSSQRMAAETINTYALSEGAPVYRTSAIPETSQAMWTKPYTTFEKVKLKGGPGVSNVAYGALYGGDTDLYNLKHGYKGVVSAFVGYNGNHMSYDGISMNQQGGTLGVTGTLYKGNFFTGLTLSAGASAAEAYTMYGNDNFAMLTAGIANKTGYNWEIKGGKVIVQPSLYTGYTFVNTFDYTNAAGVRIDSDPLNTIQLIPGVKVIGNTKTGWQPYAGIDMVWNIYAGGNHVTASQTALPQLSVKPYVQYGVGIQKSWSDKFTAFFQTMLRNGGRNGIVLQAGFRWNIGKDPSKTKVERNKSNQNKKVIKSIDSVSSKQNNSKNI